MARTRYIKPSFFTNDELGALKPAARILFTGLWCLADREGRLEDRPKKIKVQVLPFDSCNVDRLLQELHDAGFIQRYEAGERYIQIVNFMKHQQPHHKEPASEIPAPSGHADSLYQGGAIPQHIYKRVMERDRVCVECASDERLSLDHITPQSEGGEHTEENLRVLCISCNSRKGNRSSLPQAYPNVEPSLPQDQGNHDALRTLNSNGNSNSNLAAATITEDAAAAAIFRLHEDLCGSLNGTVVREIDALIDEYPQEWIEAAYREAAMNNVRKLNYVKRILERYRREGFDGDEAEEAGEPINYTERHREWANSIKAGGGLVLREISPGEVDEPDSGAIRSG